MDHYFACVDIAYEYRFDVCVCAGLCGSVHLCAGTLHFGLFFSSACCCCCSCHACITPSLKLSSSLLCDSHGRTAIEHQVLPFVTATDGASVCACVCVCVLCLLWERTHNLKRTSREDLVQECCEGAGRDRHKPTLARDFKSNRAATVTRTAAVQQQYNSGTTAPALQTLTIVTTMVLFCASHVCSVHQETCIHALNRHIYLFPRTSTILKPNTSRRTSSYHRAVYQAQYRTPNNEKQESWSRLDFSFENRCVQH